MKSLKLSCIILIFVSCSSETKNSETSNILLVQNTLDTITIGSRSFFIGDVQTSPPTQTVSNINDSTDEAAIKLSSELVRRKSDSLYLKCDTRILGLINNRGEEDFVVYDFINYDKVIDFYVIRCSQIENRSFLMVNKKNAEVFEVIGPPCVSPNKKFIVCGNCDLIARFDVNGIQVFELNNGAYKLVGLRELGNWGPESLVWKNDTTLCLRTRTSVGPNISEEIINKEIYLK